MKHKKNSKGFFHKTKKEIDEALEWKHKAALQRVNDRINTITKKNEELQKQYQDELKLWETEEREFLEKQKRNIGI